LKFNSLTDAHIKALQSMVAADRFSTGQSVLDLHARDQSSHPRCCPEAVIWPLTADEVARILKYADAHRIPITGWGSGSSLEGNPIPVKQGVVLDFSQMNRILEIREEDFQADVQPGVVYQDLNHKLKHKGLFFPPDPGARATIGGMIANNASGTRTVYYGSTKDYVLQLTVVMANGEIVEMGTRSSKTSSGYDLIHLMVGSEGTLGIVVQDLSPELATIVRKAPSQPKDAVAFITTEVGVTALTQAGLQFSFPCLGAILMFLPQQQQEILPLAL